MSQVRRVAAEIPLIVDRCRRSRRQYRHYRRRRHTRFIACTAPKTDLTAATSRNESQRRARHSAVWNSCNRITTTVCGSDTMQRHSYGSLKQSIRLSQSTGRSLSAPTTSRPSLLTTSPTAAPARPSRTALRSRYKAVESSRHSVDCAICLAEGAIQDLGVVGCGHSFCFECIMEWAARAPSCPLCKVAFTKIRRRFGGSRAAHGPLSNCRLMHDVEYAIPRPQAPDAPSQTADAPSPLSFNLDASLLTLGGNAELLLRHFGVPPPPYPILDRV
eukprot:Filipodium_phascolosomae@DN7189_c0_g1_i1.p1